MRRGAGAAPDEAAPGEAGARCGPEEEFWRCGPAGAARLLQLRLPAADAAAPRPAPHRHRTAPEPAPRQPQLHADDGAPRAGRQQRRDGHHVGDGRAPEGAARPRVQAAQRAGGPLHHGDVVGQGGGGGGGAVVVLQADGRRAAAAVRAAAATGTRTLVATRATKAAPEEAPSCVFSHLGGVAQGRVQRGDEVGRPRLEVGVDVAVVVAGAARHQRRAPQRPQQPLQGDGGARELGVPPLAQPEHAHGQPRQPGGARAGAGGVAERLVQRVRRGGGLAVAVAGHDEHGGVGALQLLGLEVVGVGHAPGEVVVAAGHLGEERAREARGGARLGAEHDEGALGAAGGALGAVHLEGLQRHGRGKPQGTHCVPRHQGHQRQHGAGLRRGKGDVGACADFWGPGCVHPGVRALPSVVPQLRATSPT
jgi:hypothetical protein